MPVKTEIIKPAKGGKIKIVNCQWANCAIIKEINSPKKMPKRPIIETVIGLQKGVLDLEHTHHRSALNAFTHMLAAVCAYSFYQRKPKVSIQTHKALKQYNGLIAA